MSDKPPRMVRLDEVYIPTEITILGAKHHTRLGIKEGPRSGQCGV